MPPTCDAITQHVGDRDGQEVPAAHGHVVVDAGQLDRRAIGSGAGSPSGHWPTRLRAPGAPGTERHRHDADGEGSAEPRHHRLHAVVLDQPSSRTGVMTMPPTDRPVLAIDRASDRRRWNQRVTTVVAGTRPHRAQPRPNTM